MNILLIEDSSVSQNLIKNMIIEAERRNEPTKYNS